jgi:hypothetical protein
VYGTRGAQYWTWMSGSPVVNQVGVNGQIRIPNEFNVSEARGYTFGWTDLHGNLWLQVSSIK